MAIGRKFDTWLSRVSSIFAFFSPIVPGTIGAFVTGWFAMGVDQINAYGWLGWWCAAVVGFFVITVLYLLTGFAKNLMVQADATRKWAREVDRIDPMAKVFENKRIKVTDLAHPITGRIKDKTFRDSELLGPENIFLLNCTLDGLHFMDCEMVIVRDNITLFNLKVFEKCIFKNGELAKCTVFLNQTDFNHFKAKIPGVTAVTYEKQ